MDIKHTLKSAKRVTLISHTRPDADTVGSVLALGEWLEESGVFVQYFCADTISHRFAWLSGVEKFSAQFPVSAGLVVSVDVPVVFMLGIPESVSVDVVIDHHPLNNVPAKIKWVKPTAAAGILVAQLIDDISESIATKLMVAILGDTGNLQFSNTDAEVLGVVAKLAQISSVSLYDIVQRTSKMSDESFSWMGRGMASLKRVGKVVFMEVDNPWAGSLTRQTSQLDCSLAVVKFVQKDEQFRVELRSAGAEVHCGELAAKFGGGGHPAAAGFQNIDPGNWDEIVADICVTVNGK